MKIMNEEKKKQAGGQKKGGKIGKIIEKEENRIPKSRSALRDALADICSEYFISKDGLRITFKSDFKKMKAGARASIMVDLAKHVVPKAKDQADIEFEQAATSALRKRLFGED